MAYIKVEKIKQFIAKFWKGIVIIATIFTLLGISLRDFILPDWQAKADEYNTKGLELYNSSNYNESIELYNKAIELESKGIDEIETIYFNRAMSYYKIGDYNHAIGDLTNAINIRPSPKYYQQRGTIYQKMGRTEDATLDYAKSVLN